ncbi:hypothetical protein PF010_g27203 [Phytophthora fragariae]|nr:hypothetical protein PF010_g27203 [Phytophthora fragariae]
MAGDVASAFRNISIHSNSVYLFAGHIEEDDIIVIELAAPFGWTGSPGFYEIAGGAVAYVHGSHTTDEFPDGMFNYHWVDDHINVAADAGTACDDATGRYGGNGIYANGEDTQGSGNCGGRFRSFVALKEGLSFADGKPPARGNMHPCCKAVSPASAPARESSTPV